MTSSSVNLTRFIGEDQGTWTATSRERRGASRAVLDGLGLSGGARMWPGGEEELGCGKGARSMREERGKGSASSAGVWF